MAAQAEAAMMVAQVAAVKEEEEMAEVKGVAMAVAVAAVGKAVAVKEAAAKVVEELVEVVTAAEGRAMAEAVATALAMELGWEATDLVTASAGWAARLAVLDPAPTRSQWPVRPLAPAFRFAPCHR